ncbi:MAG: carbon starvation protein A [Bacteroidota bacterium]|nr:carbon starvation protein A [Bacteroidota bacterium]
MSASIIALIGIGWLIFAYRWYGKKIETKVVQPDDAIPTPATELNDNQDYVPTKAPILFGHHFSSIAGAGPIVGPILAFSLFGWLPTLIWILLGTVFMGAVHDYTTMMASVRSRGVSITDITEKSVSKTARWIFTVFVWLALALVQTVFAVLTAQTLTEKPEIAIPTIGLIFLAISFGYLVYRKNINLITSTLISIGIIFILILLGDYYPIKAPYETWLLLSFAYAFIAAVIPVWVLLQPRDYLSMYLLLAGLIFGFLGIFVANPIINAPAFISFDSSTGPLWPILFITVACGAISGFHSLVASGTSAKQLRKESEAKKIAFGGMLTEGALALLVVVLIGSVLHWEAIPLGTTGGFVFQNLLNQSVNITFGTAFGLVLNSLGIPLFIGISFGVLMLNAFILTTLDTTVRLSRYIVQESIGTKIKVFNNRYIAAAIGLILAYILTIGGNWKTIWPVFGASNQLVASLALFVVTAYWFAFRRPRKFTLIPAIFMLITTEAALIYQLFWLYLPQQNFMLIIISSALIVLGFIVAIEVYKKIRSLETQQD